MTSRLPSAVSTAIGLLAGAIALVWYGNREATSVATVSESAPQITEAPVATAETVASVDEAVPDAVAVTEAELQSDPQFDDASYDEPNDDLLIIEPGDPTRYITPADREADIQRRKRQREASLTAASRVGSDRLQSLGMLGTYAGEGNEDAVAELRRVLTSDDADLRADALEAIAELLPGSDAVPAYAEVPPADEAVDRIIAALQGQLP